MVLLIVLAVLTVLVLTGTILHATYFKAKKGRLEPYGEMVDVFDGHMHVFRTGSASKTVVLLPGLGVALPSADFGPLMRSLSQDYTVVCVEYFGVGFSTQTSRERTCENYVEEIRAALSAAGFRAPYVLMPHSISSVYSEYYAAKYPDEVKAIISLDGTSTAYIGEDMPGFVKSLLEIAKVQQLTGLASVVAPLAVNKNAVLRYGYTEKELSDLVVFAGFSINDNVLDQMRNTADCIRVTNELCYPQNVPYFKVISRQTYEMKNRQIKMPPEEYQKEHLMRVGAQEHYAILSGTHFIYQMNTERIRSITDAFLASLES